MIDASAPYDAFFRAEYPRVVRVIHGVMGDRDRAEEVAQEAFARLYVRWERVSTYERPDAWVRRVAIRHALRVSRRDRLRTVLEVLGTGMSLAAIRPRPVPLTSQRSG